MEKERKPADPQTADVYGQVGEHVASVMRAAEVAAQELTGRAEHEAAAVRNAAQAEAAELLDEARQLRDDAARDAAEVRRAAQETAERELEQARARDDRRRLAIARTEERLGELASGLHGVARKLDELLKDDGDTIEAALGDAVTAAAGAQEHERPQ